MLIAMAAELFQSYTETLVCEKIPPFYPPFTAVQFGRVDTIWLGLYSATSTRTWPVLDARGMPLAQVELPSALSVHVADRSQVWGIKKTAMMSTTSFGSACERASEIRKVLRVANEVNYVSPIRLSIRSFANADSTVRAPTV